MFISIEKFLASLPIMGFGMLGIFIVIGVIMVCVAILTKIFPAKKD